MCGVFHRRLNKALAPFDLIHVEVCGPYQTMSSCGAVNLTVVDEYSCSVWTWLMLAKSEIKNLVQNFCAMSQRQFDKPVRMVWSDNGMKFMSLTGYFSELGIMHQTS